MDKSRSESENPLSNDKEPRDRTGVDLILARLLSDVSDDAVQSPNITLARHALRVAVNDAAETMMLLYLLEEPFMKALVLAAAQIPLKERKRVLSELAALEAI